MTMILIGQYDSPFVRRVAVALNFYGLSYEHRPWSTFSDADKLAAYNPLRRVPTLVLEGDEVLIESMAILDHLDQQVDLDHRLIPAAGSERRAALKTCALATGLCDKMVSLIYERALHQETSDAWIARCTTQVSGVLSILEAQCAALATPFWFGGRPGHADIAVACAMRFLREAHPDIAAVSQSSALVGHAERCEAMREFSSVVQRFDPPRR
ncbi:glutathione S-transferase family protein [Novosphingobium sp. Rr 2-17]|uniref:glutathione S-transferase family protein n=1 Tax=Novosphingobium sp. Rr 2-17 TaxID=555793 RepID=UPI00192AB1D8|nr:glutathione S-transferase family protein [Novosphingobium sp. Rr 2-17]